MTRFKFARCVGYDNGMSFAKIQKRRTLLLLLVSFKYVQRRHIMTTRDLNLQKSVSTLQ